MQALENLSEPQVIIFIAYLDSEQDSFITSSFSLENNTLYILFCFTKNKYKN